MLSGQAGGVYLEEGVDQLLELLLGWTLILCAWGHRSYLTRQKPGVRWSHYLGYGMSDDPCSC